MWTLRRIASLLIVLALLSGGGYPAGAAQDHPAKGNAGTFEHVHALALDAEDRVLWLGAHTGLFRSEDGGRSWQRARLLAPEAHVDVMAIAPHPSDARRLYVGTHDAGVLRSTDGGRAWQAVNAGLAGLDVHGLAMDPTTPEKLHAAVREEGEGLYRTTDGGGRWTRVDDGPGGEVKGARVGQHPDGHGRDLAICRHRRGLAARPRLLLRVDARGRSAHQPDG